MVSALKKAPDVNRKYSLGLQIWFPGFLRFHLVN